MNKRHVQFQALVLAGILAATPLSFADAKPQVVKATALTQASKVDMKFEIKGTVSAIDNNVLTVKTEDKLTYTVKLDKLSNLANFKELAAKGSKVLINCDLSQGNFKVTKAESVSIESISANTATKDVKLSVVAIPAETAKVAVGGVVEKASPVALTKAFNISQAIPLDFAVSLEIEGKVFNFN